MKPDLVHNRREFADIVARARARTLEIQALDPTWGFTGTILRQLDFVAQATAGQRLPTPEEKQQIDLGPLAVRNLDESDPEYSDLLKEIYYQFRRYESLPR